MLSQRLQIGDNYFMKIDSGEVVIAVLHSPREKLLGTLHEISAAGVSLRSVDLSYFDDWCSSIAAGEQHLSMTDYFIPMWRVERISRDEGDDAVPSMVSIFETKTGLNFFEQ